MLNLYWKVAVAQLSNIYMVIGEVMKSPHKRKMLALVISFATVGALALPLQASAIEARPIDERMASTASAIPVGGYALSGNWQTVYTKNDNRTGTITFEATKVSPLHHIEMRVINRNGAVIHQKDVGGAGASMSHYVDQLAQYFQLRVVPDFGNGWPFYAEGECNVYVDLS